VKRILEIMIVGLLFIFVLHYTILIIKYTFLSPTPLSRKLFIRVVIWGICMLISAICRGN